MSTAVVVLSIMLAVVFGLVGAAKVAGAERQLAEGRKLGFSARSYVVLGALELAGAAGVLAGLVWAPLGLAAAAGLLAMMVGAVVVQVRAGQTGPALGPALGVGGNAAALVVLHALVLLGG